MRLRGSATISALAAALVGLAAPAAMACPPVWTQVAAPSFHTGEDRILGMSAVSDSTIWSVGMSDAGGFVQRWGGSAWTTRLGPVFTDNYYAIAAAGGNVWVGGQHHVGGDDFRTRIRRWNGSAWSTPATPNPSTNPDEWNIIDGLAAISATNVWAVGSYSTVSQTRPMILHWNGTAWSTATMPVGVQGRLHAVAANGPNDIWAVGDGVGATSLAMHYNGVAWSVQTSDDPHPDRNSLVAVAHSPDDEWAAVGYGRDHPLAPLALGWDGIANWDSQIVSAPSGTSLWGVAALGWSDMWAAGSRPGAGGMPRTHVLHWQGTSWQGFPTPNVDDTYEGFMGATATPSGNVWAYGYRDTYDKTLYERLCPIKILDTGFAPGSERVAQGATVAWSYAVTNSAVHSISESGLFLFSDVGDAGESFTYRFTAAGTYVVHESASGANGSVAVPVTAARVPGTVRRIQVDWAVGGPAPGLVFDVQRRRNSGAWTAWRTGATARGGAYSAGAPGRYSFRARLRQPPGTANVTGWSPVDTVLVR